MTDAEDRVAKKKAEYELAVAELEMLVAKDQYRENRTPEAKAAKDAAVKEVMALREIIRADRPVGAGVYADGEKIN